MKNLFKVSILSFVLVFSLTACNDSEKQPQQQAVQEAVPPQQPRTMHDAVTESHRDLMERMSADCDGRGIAGAKECWIAKINSLSYNLIQDRSAMRGIAKTADPRFLKEVTWFTSSQGPVGDCNKVAGMVPKKIAFCRAFELAYINVATQYLEAGAWQPEDNEQFEGE